MIKTFFKLRLKPEVTTAVSPGAISTPVLETLHLCARLADKL